MLVLHFRLVCVSVSGGTTVQGVLVLLIRWRQRIIVTGALVLLVCLSEGFFDDLEPEDQLKPRDSESNRTKWTVFGHLIIISIKLPIVGSVLVKSQ